MQSIQLFCLFLFMSTFCMGQRIDSLTIGSGGGFTGQVTSYKVIKCKIYKGKGLAAIKYSEEAKLKRRSKKILNKGAKGLQKKNTSLNKPSNTYKFIRIYSKGKITEIVWGDPSPEIPKEVIDYYDKISEVIKNLKFTTQ